MKHEEIKELISIFDESDLTKLKINNNDFAIVLEKGALQSAAVPVSAPVVAAPVEAAPAPVKSEESEAAAVSENMVTIDSPMVGTFYVAPSPGAAPFVRVGDKVSKDQTIGIVEAMKIMNEIAAEFDCVIKRMLVEDGQPVEFGTPLFEVEKL
jgi:acetyl-CoA carboxylase biotin carboxyl carrier protein